MSAAAPVPVPSQVRATGVVATGMMTMNVLAYGFTLLCARLLGPNPFGAISALLSVLIVANVGALALQATGARRLATSSPEHRPTVTGDLLRDAWLVAGALGLVLLALAPAVNRLLHLDDWVVACLPAFAAVPLTLMGAYAGILQGGRRWVPLSVVYASMGLARLVVGGAAVVIEPTLRSAMVGVAVGGIAPALVGAAYCRGTAGGPRDHQPALRELWSNGHALLAFFAFTNFDVLLARHLFDQHDAGIYAAGAILAKACLFLPTFVLVVAFPTMAAERNGRPWLKPLLAVAALGLAAVLGTALLPDLAVAFAGGSEYADLTAVAWLFALEGTLFACLQILVYETIAAQAHAASVLWLASAVVAVVAVPVVDSVQYLVTIVALAAFGAAVTTTVTARATGPD